MTSGVARAFPGGRVKMRKKLRKIRKNWLKFEERMRKQEVLPTWSCEAGYTPEHNLRQLLQICLCLTILMSLQHAEYDVPRGHLSLLIALHTDHNRILKLKLNKSSQKSERLAQESQDQCKTCLYSFGCSFVPNPCMGMKIWIQFLEKANKYINKNQNWKNVDLLSTLSVLIAACKGLKEVFILLLRRLFHFDPSSSPNLTSCCLS